MRRVAAAVLALGVLCAVAPGRAHAAVEAVRPADDLVQSVQYFGDRSNYGEPRFYGRPGFHGRPGFYRRSHYYVRPRYYEPGRGYYRRQHYFR